MAEPTAEQLARRPGAAGVCCERGVKHLIKADGAMWSCACGLDFKYYGTIDMWLIERKKPVLRLVR